MLAGIEAGTVSSRDAADVADEQSSVGDRLAAIEVKIDGLAKTAPAA